MTGRDLENLSKVPVPQPRANAKRAALEAALKEFDAASRAAGSPQAESPATTVEPQGNVRTLRQTETTRAKRSFRMPSISRPQMAMAASVAAVLIAAPLALRQLHENTQTTFREFSSQPNSMTSLTAPPSAPGSEGRIAVTPPLDIDRKDLAAKGADPANPVIEPSPPRDALGAVGQTGNGMSISIGGGKPAGAEVASEPNEPAIAAPPPATLPAQESVIADTGVARGNFALNGSSKREESAIAMSPPPPPAPAAPVAAQPAKPATTMMASRMGVMEKKKLDGLAWMGGEADERVAPQVQEENRDKFEAKEINPVKQVANEPVSTFSIDVDTASYSFVRRALNAGHLPPKDAVRVEELINYFPYAYPGPDTANIPFKPAVNVFDAPWNPRNKLVHVAIKGYDLKSAERPRANLVLLMDVSGSMQPEDRLPLIKNAFRLLVDQLQPEDTIGIVTYASGSGVALEPTKVSDKGKILAAIDRLGAGGSTAGAAGIQDAYRLAESNFDKSAVNRIILATDGDFNVGITNQDELKGFIERKRQSGIFLSILGVGQGNHNDALMQALAQNGNGTAAYVDTLNEARKVLVDESSSTLFTIAKDVKVQIEWNPQRVSEYRLIGYETRNLKREDFNNDRVDAGDIGSGHTVTAIYEVTPVGAPKLVDDLRYAAKAAVQSPAQSPGVQASGELGFLKLRYKRPKEDTSNLIELPITDSGVPDGADPKPVGPDSEMRFSTAVAAFGQLLKGEPYTQGYTFDDVLKLAQGARGDDPFGYRAEFLNLVRLAKSARP